MSSLSRNSRAVLSHLPRRIPAGPNTDLLSAKAASAAAAWRHPHGRLHDPSSQRRSGHLSALTSALSSGLSSFGWDRTATGPDHDATFPPPPPRCGRPASTIEKPLPWMPFHFETGVGLFAKRQPRPFPPPFLSPPSSSFSDPLTTHHRSLDPRRGRSSDGQPLGGCTNGDDAVYASEYFIAANDGVGAWATRPRGHAGLWARLVAHFWADAIYADVAGQRGVYHPAATDVDSDAVRYLQQAYEHALSATEAPNDWQGTTTAAGAQLAWQQHPAPEDVDGASDVAAAPTPLLYVTNLGDSQVMVVRPSESRVVFKTKEQWHWFDCPRQLGTNSPDTPRTNAVVDVVPINVGDIVLAMSDGVIDNLWSHEIVARVSQSVAAWQAHDDHGIYVDGQPRGMMQAVAEELVEAARVIAVDPFAESPFMEHAVEEGLPGEGGKLDDISVVAAICRRSDAA